MTSMQNESTITQDMSYLEVELPDYLRHSINEMENSWTIIDRGQDDLHWDVNWCELYSDINYAEIESMITSEQAEYLRKKYLRMEKKHD